MAYIIPPRNPESLAQRAESLTREILKKEMAISRLKDEILDLRVKMTQLFHERIAASEAQAAPPKIEPAEVPDLFEHPTTNGVRFQQEPPEDGMPPMPGAEGKTIKERILALLNGAGPRVWTTPEIMREVGVDNFQTIASTVSRLYGAGLIEKCGRREWTAKDGGGG